ncbi:MAG: cytochrome-c oxidase, cbb3-type subunit III [Zoogloeaceae bacterium]|jgi:cytochrome c oxidase cbb3-type subunit 3|nr:cytochrome-c oxidase, cbb3-type subunit III [Zoogloeaceae bacterium]
MSDFTIPLVGIIVAAVTLIGVIGCIVFLWSQDNVAVTVGKTTGHAWDETLEEYNNPLPKWWNWLFYITVIFSLVYLVLFPGLGTFPGMLGWCSQSYGDRKCGSDQYGGEVKQASALLDQYKGQELQALARNPQAMETGKRLFMTYCMQCHGADAGGKPGFPNLTDSDWLYGGETETILESISGGRRGVMTSNEYLGADKIKALANYVLSVNGRPSDTTLANRGRELYMGEAACRTCHGDDMKGNKLLGAPNLTNNIWLYGASEEEIIKGITYGRNVGDGRSTNNKMPAWKEFLGEDKVRLLAAYVYSLSNR